MKANYSAWEVQRKDFPKDGSSEDKLRYLVSYAVLAPSSHNTQPWHFKIADGFISVELEQSRWLSVSDPDHREQTMSVGAAIENIILAAESFGIKLDITIKRVGLQIARLTINGSFKPKTDWTKIIKLRHSNRTKFSTDKLPSDLLSALKSIRENDVTVTLIQDHSQKEVIANLSVKATKQLFGQTSFRSELATWVRNNWTQKYDGMPGYSQGMPGPPSLLAKLIIKNMNVGADQAKKDAERLMEAPLLAAIGVKEHSIANWINAGRIYERICLVVTQHNHNTSGVSAAAVVDKTNHELQDQLRLKSIPVAILRIGKANKPAKHTPRHTAEQVSD
ncbi:hypothetical protein IT414_01860 [bacterium]|nr:hypothetical protein [bacterium]